MALSRRHGATGESVVEAAMSAAVGSLRRLWKRPAIRAGAWQLLALGLIAALAWYVSANVRANLPRMKLELGFGFLWDKAAFEIGDNLVDYHAGESILKAFVAGLGNTIQVAVIGIVLTTLLGSAIALARLSNSLIVALAAWLYVETVRNIPLLLQLYFWHLFLVKLLPAPRLAWNPLPGVFLSNRGLAYPTLGMQPIFTWMLIVALTGVLLAWAWARRARRRRDETGAQTATLLPGLALIFLPPLVLFLLFGDTLQWDAPILRGFNFQGGGNRVPEFAVLIFGLVTYQAGFAAETIRAGILGVSKGQIEAAKSLGLSRGRMMRLVILPQALRIVVPPLASQFLSLTNNTSLAVAIGYPDIVRVSMVVTGDTGRAVECVTIILVVYLVLSLATAAFMNWFNARIAFEGRT